MKRLPFKSITLFTILVMAGPAIAETPPVKTPLEQLSEAKDKDQIRTVVDAATLANFGVVAVISGKTVKLQGEIPDVCAQHLELTKVDVERIEGADDKDLVTIEDLNALSTKVVPQVTFVGAAAVKDFAACMAIAHDEKKSKLADNSKLSKEVLLDDESAYVGIKQADSKSGEYLKLEKAINLVHCDTCGKTAEDVKILSKYKNKGAKKLVSLLSDSILSGYAAKIADATTKAELEAIRDAVMKYMKEVDESEMSAAAKKAAHVDIHAILAIGLSNRAMDLAKEESTATGDAKKSVSSEDRDAKYSAKIADAKIKTKSPASDYLVFISETKKIASGISGITSTQKANDLLVSSEILKSGSEVRTDKLKEINLNDPELVTARDVAITELWDTAKKFKQECAAIVQCGDNTQCLHANFASEAHFRYNFTQCGNYTATIQKDEKLLASLRTNASLPNQSIPSWNGIGMNYSNGLTPYDPFALNPAYIPQANDLNNRSGINTYQATDVSQLYKVDRSGNQLPVAIPLKGFGYSPQQFQNFQSQT